MGKNPLYIVWVWADMEFYTHFYKYDTYTDKDKFNSFGCYSTKLQMIFVIRFRFLFRFLLVACLLRICTHRNLHNMIIRVVELLFFLSTYDVYHFHSILIFPLTCNQIIWGNVFRISEVRSVLCVWGKWFEESMWEYCANKWGSLSW